MRNFPHLHHPHPERISSSHYCSREPERPHIPIFLRVFGFSFAIIFHAISKWGYVFEFESARPRRLQCVQAEEAEGTFRAIGCAVLVMLTHKSAMETYQRVVTARKMNDVCCFS